MVRLYSIAIIKDSKIIDSAFELSDFSFFKRSTIKELCLFASVEGAKRTLPGRMTSLEYQSMICYTYVNSDVAISCLSDTDYPSRIIVQFLHEALVSTDLDQLLYRYQDITKVDKIYAIKQQLDETKQICNNSIDQLMIRGDELQDLIKRTELLSDASKDLVDETKKLNSCC